MCIKSNFRKINILGTYYTIEELSRTEDKILNTCDGYCDKTSKRIVIVTRPEDCELDNFEEYRKKILRHEIIHAFLFGSGLQENFKHDTWGHDEIMVDWIAIQFPKLLDVFKQLNII